MSGDKETVAIYHIASHLHKTIGEILQLTTEELAGWSAYLSHISYLSTKPGK